MNDERKITKQKPRNYIFEGYDLTEILVILHDSFDKDYFNACPEGTRSSLGIWLTRAHKAGVNKITVKIYRRCRYFYLGRPLWNLDQPFHYRKGEGLIKEEGEA